MNDEKTMPRGGYSAPDITVTSIEIANVLCTSGIIATGEQPGETEDL